MDQTSSDIATKVAVNALTEVFKTCYHGLKGVKKWVIEENKEHDFFGTAASKYLRAIQERYDTIRIFGMSEPVKLSNIYTRVDVLKKITSRQIESVEDLEKFFDRDTRNFGKKIESMSGAEVVQKLSKFILLGKPGAGKTTFLKYVALQFASGQFSENRIPIFISLKGLSDSNKSLLDYIIEQFDICRFQQAGPFVERILDQGKSIILLDALDEVSDDRLNEVTQHIINITDKYSGNKCIITCRFAAYNYYFEKFSDVEMADFSDYQITTFVNNWFNPDTDTAQDCLKQINQSSQIRELASVPLLLTLLCLAYNETLGFSPNKADLYKEAIDALLKRWDSSRRIRRSKIYESLSVTQKENMLSRIAAATFEKNKYFIEKKELCKHIGDYLINLPEVNNGTIEIDSEAVLKSIEAHHGIFVERAKNIFSFSHLTFQEYFTAQYIVDNTSKGSVERLVSKYALKPNWREVFLITAGMMSDAEPLLSSLIQVAGLTRGLDMESVSIPLFSLLDKINEYKESSLEYALLRVLLLMSILARMVEETNKNQNENITDGNMIIIITQWLSLDTTIPYGWHLDINHENVFTLILQLQNMALALLTLMGLDSKVDHKSLGQERVQNMLTKCNDLSHHLSRDLIKKGAEFIMRDEGIQEVVHHAKINVLMLECLSTGCYLSIEKRSKILNAIAMPLRRK